MNKALVIVIVIVMVAVFVAGARATSTISTNIPGVPATGGTPCDFVFSFYKFAMMIGGILAFGAIVYGGVKYTLAAGNPSGQSEGKEWVKGALLGLVLLVSAYLILNVINPDLVKCTLPVLKPLSANNITTGGGATSWQLCQVSAAGNMCVADYSSQADCQSHAGVTLNCYPGSCDSGSPCNNTNTGSCPTTNSGACSTDNMSACSAWDKNQASAVCLVEAGDSGNLYAKSGSDFCIGADGNASPVSFSLGLFQINALANSNIMPSACSGLFTVPAGSPTAQGTCLKCSGGTGPACTGGLCTGWNCSFPGTSGQYQSCRDAEANESTVLGQACGLYQGAGDTWKPWTYTANKVCKFGQ